MTDSKQTNQKTQPTTESSLNGQTSKYTQEEVLAALYNVEDLMARCLTVDSFLVLGDLGKAIRENGEFDGKELEFGLEKRYLTKEVRDTLRDYAPEGTEFTDKGFTTKYGQFPVKFKFINRDYGFFRNPEKIAYWAGEFNVPNPFDNYFKARWIIQ